ncbi:hypothetical protein BGZ61DRAFT_463713 [Ilyonectria robusta]|uniref:uncharacterized protein n=1 Tax=Ilyonectria robusta TaxID=1079257 RepID=UPI001E8E0710|nr:uncharacterized protein BGZ61DRAFT_463713 [Ilyonectria robusta]KAH8661823.1 hypothetical protein BGZ61DRAFT_463713 [Ilyonectria robusta]
MGHAMCPNLLSCYGIFLAAFSTAMTFESHIEQISFFQQSRTRCFDQNPFRRSSPHYSVGFTGHRSGLPQT